MHHLKTVLLRHEERGGGHHYDWMIEDPRSDPPDPAGCSAAEAEAGGALLATWRVGSPSWEWTGRGTLELVRIQPHRRAYLTYEGPLSGGRGSVRRVDQGSAVVRAWSASAATLEVDMTRFTGAIRLERTGHEEWTAVVSPAGRG